MAESRKRVECPVCQELFLKDSIERHVDECLNIQDDDDEMVVAPSPPVKSEIPLKKSGFVFPNSKSPKIENLQNLEKFQKEFKESHEEKISLLNLKKLKIKNTVSISTISAWQSLMATKNSTRDSAAPSKHSQGSSRESDQTPSIKQAEKSPDLSVTPPNKDTNSSTMKLKPGIPLAEQLRPTDLVEYSGQEKILGENQILRKLLEKHQIPSMILWGPPGCGKTTLARIVASKCQKSQNTRFSQLSATTAGVADVKEVVKVAKNELRMLKRRTVLFIDEIHRFNKLQQDALLPHVEDGTFVLIGATTENPSFRVNNALLSRCKLIVLEALSELNILEILRRVLVKLDIQEVDVTTATDHNGAMCIETEAISLLAKCSDGDARRSLNALQTAIEVCTHELKSVIMTDSVRESLQRSHVRYDRAGDEHYDCASALQKSIRGSSDSGAIYWLARMLEGGEDPLFVARRLLVCASEDIGLADPNALSIAVATSQACQFLGFPECKYNLSHCAVYLARATKSAECTMAYKRAKASILNQEGPLPGVPLHLRNAPTQMMKDLGYGKDYKWNHEYSEPVQQEYLPDGLQQQLNLFGDYKKPAH